MLSKWILLLLLPLSFGSPLEAPRDGHAVKKGKGGIKPPATFKHYETKYRHTMKKVAKANRDDCNCKPENIAIRRSWHKLSTDERLDYIRAVKCLHGKPSLADPARSPGNRNRMDDFTFTHINQTLHVHGSGFILPWHRNFVFNFEKSLREECGYKGYQPYWDCARWSDDPQRSPLFDGSPTSLGGNGVNINEKPRNVSVPGLPQPFSFTMPAGTGGGCMTTGPFVSFNASLGPVTPGSPPTPGDTFGEQYNPRCLRRSFTPSISKQRLNWDRVLSLLQTATMDQFRPLLEGGIHAGMHATVGGDVFDFFTSPSDCAFYFIHAQMDRLWSIWQAQDWARRKDALYGTSTFANLPPSSEVTVDTWMDMVYAGGMARVGDSMSTVDGPYCYIYE